MKEFARIFTEYVYWFFNQWFTRKHALTERLKKGSGSTLMIRDYRLHLRKNRTVFNNPGPGAGSKSVCKTLSEAARVMSIRPDYGNVLYNLARSYKPETIIELGTAFGVSTMYLALGSPDSQIITVEGNQHLALMAAESFRHHKLNHIQLKCQFFDEALSDLNQEIKNNSLVFIDGNHTYESTVRYYHTFSKASILVLDDIRWSEDMHRAWKNITSGLHSDCVVDLFGMGIIFKNPELTDLIKEI